MNATRLGEILFHDATIRRVVELPDSHELLFYVDYAVDWERNMFEPRIIAFQGVWDYHVGEGWCEGCPVLLDYEEFAGRDGWSGVILNTNHGTRRLLFWGVELRNMPVNWE